MGLGSPGKKEGKKKREKDGHESRSDESLLYFRTEADDGSYSGAPDGK